MYGVHSNLSTEIGSVGAEQNCQKEQVGQCWEIIL